MLARSHARDAEFSDGKQKQILNSRIAGNVQLKKTVFGHLLGLNSRFAAYGLRELSRRIAGNVQLEKYGPAVLSQQLCARWFFSPT